MGLVDLQKTFKGRSGRRELLDPVRSVLDDSSEQVAGPVTSAEREPDPTAAPAVPVSVPLPTAPSLASDPEPAPQPRPKPKPSPPVAVPVVEEPEAPRYVPRRR